MSFISVRRSAEHRDLINSASVISTLQVTDNQERQDIIRLTSAVSRTIEDFTGRVFARELITEKLGVHDLDIGALDSIGLSSPFRLMLRRTPVLMVQAIRFDGRDIDLDDVVLEDAEAGFLFRRGGFTTTALTGQQIETVRTRFTDPLWEVDYSAGYVLPSFPTQSKRFTSAEVDTTTNEITAAGHAFVVGDTVRFLSEGTLPGGLSDSIDYIIRSINADRVQLTDRYNGAAVDLTSGGTGEHTISRKATLPASLQNDAMLMVVSQFRSRLRDPTIESERLGDYQVKYESPGDMPQAIRERLERYRDLVT